MSAARYIGLPTLEARDPVEGDRIFDFRSLGSPYGQTVLSVSRTPAGLEVRTMPPAGEAYATTRIIPDADRNRYHYLTGNPKEPKP